MEAEPPLRTTAYFRDLEQVHSPVEFAELVFSDVEKALSTQKRVATKARRFLTEIGGVQVTAVKIPQIAAAHWKRLLTETLADLAEADTTVVFFWDELPWMIENIKRRFDEKASMELLDALRAIRQMHPKLRMVYTGSIGLHHVLAVLRNAGYGNTPTNDMFVFDVPPLEPAGAADLAGRLLTGESVRCADLSASSAAIAKATDCVAFYVQHVVDQLSSRGLEASPESIDVIITDALTASQDPWDLRHFRERIDRYYGDETPIALTLLDEVAIARVRVSFDEIFNAIKVKTSTANEEQVRELLVLLESDHYISRDADGHLAFKLPLLRRWWRLHRGL